MKNQAAKSYLPFIVLIAGLTLVIIVFSLSFVPSFFPFEPVETIDEAQELANQYIMRYYDGLEISEIMEFENSFYVIAIEENSRNGAFELLVDRYSGRISLEPGPNMMWNTKYGHHGTLDNPTTVMPIDITTATMDAQNWLNQNTPGYRVLETSVFYGYYTMDFGEKGKIFGMLSVNGYSGEVWYHSWHGDFITMVEY